MARTSRLRKAPTEAPAQSGASPNHLEDCWDEPEPVVGASTGPVRTDIEKLQGAWVTILGRRQASLLVSGNQFTVHFADGEIYMGPLTLGAFGRPREMDMRIDEGPTRHKGQTAQCIYELVGDTLRWCTAWPGQSNRLKAFPAENDAHSLYLVFRREHQNGKA